MFRREEWADHRHDVLARPQEAADHVDVLELRREMDAVRIGGDDLFNVIGRQHAGRRQKSEGPTAC